MASIISALGPIIATVGMIPAAAIILTLVVCGEFSGKRRAGK